MAMDQRSFTVFAGCALSYVLLEWSRFLLHAQLLPFQALIHDPQVFRLFLRGQFVQQSNEALLGEADDGFGDRYGDTGVL